MRRVFTYENYIAEARSERLTALPHRQRHSTARTSPNPAGSFAPYKVYNIGNHQPVELMRFIESIEQALGQ